MLVPGPEQRLDFQQQEPVSTTALQHAGARLAFLEHFPLCDPYVQPCAGATAIGQQTWMFVAFCQSPLLGLNTEGKVLV